MTYNEQTEAEIAVSALLTSLNITFEVKSVIKELEKHHEFPSLLAVSDVLKWFKVQNDAYQVSCEELIEVPVPFIAHTKPGGDFVTVIKVTQKHIITIGTNGKESKVDFEQFKKYYAGVVLIAESKGEASNSVKKKWISRLIDQKNYIVIIGLILSFLTWVFLYTDFLSVINIQIGYVLLIKSLGLILSVLLLSQSVNKNNTLIQSICGFSKNSDCNSILLSKAAVAFYGITWSELGFFYFSGTWLLLIIQAQNPIVMFVISLMNIFTLPYTIYSINYQLRIVKQWCLLCCGIQACFWMEFLGLFKQLNAENIVFTIPSIISIFLTFLITISAWIILKPILFQAQQVNILKNQLYKFKYNKELFEISLKKQPKYTIPHNDWSIVLGNAEANTIITMVSSPFCPPCSATHNELDQWIDRLGDIQLRIIFTGNSTNREKVNQVVMHLMAINELGDEHRIKTALKDWYEQKQRNYDEWAKVHPVEISQQHSIKLERQRAWCEIADIKFTPTILINGFLLPQNYHVSDIKYMIG